jgi:Asp-tRNA(Asn)/Glu-tRNA(Gln) amidotransferase A subunit family amidase
LEPSAVSNKKWYNYFVVTDPAATTPEAGAEPAAPRRVTDVVRDTDSETTFTEPVATPTELAEIYASARINTPAHGYTVLKVAEMLQSEHIKALPPEVKQKSIMVALDAAGVKIAEIVEDAVQRDRALDTYERVLQKHLEDLREQKARDNQALEAEINQRVAELRARVDQNNAELTAEQNNLLSWRVRKRQEEERIAEAVGYFVTENPITTSAATSDKGGSNAR